MNSLSTKLTSFKKQCLAAEQIEVTNSELTSRSGGNFYALPGEEWPQYENQPLVAILSVRIDELPFIPDQLKHLALLNIFASEDHGIISEQDGSVVIREYTSLNDLKPLTNPFQKPVFKIKWISKDDYPNAYQLEKSLTADEYKEYCDKEEELSQQFPNHHGIKISGWPHLIQGTYFLKFDRPDFVIQFDSNEVFMFCDSGVGYFMKDKQWSTAWETA